MSRENFYATPNAIRLLAAGAVLVCLVALFSGKALGLGVQYFYDVTGSAATACDVGPRGDSGTNYSNTGCSDTRQIVLRTGQANLVPIQTTTVQANFLFPTGPTGTPQITIRGAHVCIQNPTGINSRDYVRHGYFSYNEPTVTNTTRLDTLWGASVVNYQVGRTTGSLRNLPDGLFRRAANPDCDVAAGTGNIVVTLQPSDFSPVPGVPGMYYTLFRAQHIDNHQPAQVCTKTSNTGTGGPCDGITNSFAVRISGTGAHSITTTAQTGSCVSAQSCATLQARDGDSNQTTGNFNTYKIRFGSDCSVPIGGEMAALNFYDLDYGNDPLTNTIVKVTVHNETNNTWLWAPGTSTGGDDWRAAQPTYAQAYQPPTSNGSASRIWFRAQPNHNYVAYIMNVRPVLVMQVGTPYDGIYYTQTCPTPTSSVTPAAVITNTGSSVPLNQATDYVAAGSNVTATGQLINNSATYTGYVNATWIAWFDNGDSQPSPATDQTLATAGPQNYSVAPGATLNIGSVATVADGAYAQICSRVYNVTALPATAATPTVTTVTTNTVTTCIPIERRPYFQVLNGDVNATASVQPACNVGTSTISAFYAAGTGSRAEIAAFALGTITEFRSADGAGTGTRLTFANTIGGPNGGQFGQSYCIPTDFWAGATGNNLTRTEVGASPLSVITNGDVYITSDFQYGPTFAPNAIPYRLVAARNIFISGNVDRLDGVYAATGTIYTCATGTGTTMLPATPTNMVSQCGVQLTVNGAFIAGAGVKLLRTHDTLGGQPAELFIYSPEVWLQAIQGGNTTNTFGIDSITSLPPIL